MDIVTGGLGFIGSHLVDLLLTRGFEVAVIDKAERPDYVERVRGKGFRVFHGDVRDLEFVRSVFEEVRPETVYHLAALASHRLSINKPHEYLDVNIRGVVNVLEAARLAEPTPKVVFSSSSSVYGFNKSPLREDMEAMPKGPYAVSKYAGERICKLYSETYGIKCIVLRYFNVVGERCRENIVLKVFVDDVARGRSPRVNGRWIDGVFRPASRDFTYVGDVAEGTLLASRLSCSFEVLNIGAGRPVSVLELAEKVLKVMGARNMRPVFAEIEPHEVLESFSDNSKAKSLLGWAPKTSIDEVVERYVAWYMAKRPH